jgi:Fungal N-terminal domain of STAND proteins
MDPVSILSLISGAGSVGRLVFQSGESLYTFIERTRDVDQSIRSLHRETVGLGQTITAIQDALQQPAIKNHQTVTQDYALVWATLDNSIRDCEDTARTMKQKFQSAQPARNSVLSQAWRQYRLSLKEGEIRGLKSQIHTHASRLQLSMQMISVYVSCFAKIRLCR